MSEPTTRRGLRRMNRGYFALALWYPKASVNLGTAIRSAYAFGAAFVATIGHRYHRQPSDVGAAWRHMPVFHHADMTAFLAALPIRCPLVGVELSARAKPLPQAMHPESAVYLLGPEDGSLPDEILTQCCRTLYIPGAAWCLNVASAASIVLYDRIAKHAAKGMEPRRPLYFIDPPDGLRDVEAA